MPGSPFRPVFERLAGDVERAWGHAARYDLEVRMGLLGELSDLWRDVGPQAWDLGVAEALRGEPPQLRGPKRAMVARVLIVAIKAAQRVAPQSEVVTPVRQVGRYERALLALLHGPCDDVPGVQ